MDKDLHDKIKKKLAVVIMFGHHARSLAKGKHKKAGEGEEAPDVTIAIPVKKGALHKKGALNGD